jgi:hypothetical protein
LILPYFLQYFWSSYCHALHPVSFSRIRTLDIHLLFLLVSHLSHLVVVPNHVYYVSNTTIPRQLENPHPCTDRTMPIHSTTTPAYEKTPTHLTPTQTMRSKSSTHKEVVSHSSELWYTHIICTWNGILSMQNRIHTQKIVSSSEWRAYLLYRTFGYFNTHMSHID